MKARALLAVLVLALAGACAGLPTGPVRDGPTLVSRWNHAFYFPGSARGRVPLLVYLHGCSQPTWHSERTTRLRYWAERHGFAVLMPEQNRLRNGWRCWNWFLGDDSLEMDEIVDLVRAYQERFPLLEHQTYVMGLSAGGVMTAHLLACRSDVFRGGVVVAGGPYRGLWGFPSEPGNLRHGGSPRSFRALAESAASCMAERKGARPVDVLAIHGSADTISRRRNGLDTARQFALANTLLVSPSSSEEMPAELASTWHREMGAAFRHQRTVFATAPGARVEFVEIAALEHAWSGGPAWLPFSDAAGPDITAMALRFLGLWSR